MIPRPLEPWQEKQSCLHCPAFCLGGSGRCVRWIFHSSWRDPWSDQGKFGDSDTSKWFEPSVNSAMSDLTISTLDGTALPSDIKIPFRSSTTKTIYTHHHFFKYTLLTLFPVLKTTSDILDHIDMRASRSSFVRPAASIMQFSHFTTCQRCSPGLRSGECAGWIDAC